MDGTECVSGIGTGTETATFTNGGRFVATNSGFHVEGTTTIDSHTVFTNGYYINASGHSHSAFDTSFTSGQTVSTSGGPEIHTIYQRRGRGGRSGQVRRRLSYDLPRPERERAARRGRNHVELRALPLHLLLNALSTDLSATARAA